MKIMPDSLLLCGTVSWCRDNFKDAPNFMIADVELALAAIDIFIARLLTDRDLDQQVKKLMTSNNLEVKLAPKQTPKAKVVKI
ncbi:hypothetical protein [Ralstonia solanacearum]|uniref:hypothetical protein n=2 Tax=Ralstonia solanacearum TaxID=305 RepID=UPI0013DE1148|nr:hypothetical protein [Ralstonia solanacearum]